MVAAHEVIAGAPVPRERAPMLRALGREIDRALPHGRIPVDEALDGDRVKMTVSVDEAEPEEPAPGSIVVGVDGSPASMAALRWALPMVRQEGCPLEIVSVWSNPTAEALHQIPGHVNEQREAAARAAATAATLARRELGATAVVSTVTMKGEVADVLSERARAARFLVLGSPRELGAVVPGQCQHQVHCPVFIVVPPHAG